MEAFDPRILDSLVADGLVTIADATVHLPP
jgi:hypothetical protein